MTIDINDEPMTHEEIEAIKENLKRKKKRVSLIFLIIDVFTVSFFLPYTSCWLNRSY